MQEQQGFMICTDSSVGMVLASDVPLGICVVARWTYAKEHCDLFLARVRKVLTLFSGRIQGVIVDVDENISLVKRVGVPAIELVPAFFLVAGGKYVSGPEGFSVLQGVASESQMFAYLTYFPEILGVV